MRKSLKEVREKALHIPEGNAFQEEGTASAKALRGHMPGNEISASGAEGGGREWWEVRSGQQGPQRQDRHITCHSNFEDKRGCINNYAQITRDTG